MKILGFWIKVIYWKFEDASAGLLVIMLKTIVVKHGITIVIWIIGLHLTYTHSIRLRTNDKIKLLRQKHSVNINAYSKRHFIKSDKQYVNWTLAKDMHRYFHRLKKYPLFNTTKRGYVFYPAVGISNRRHFPHGTFRELPGGLIGSNLRSNSFGGGCSCDEGCTCYGCCEDDDIPEFTHTHHVVRYHHHIGKEWSCIYSMQRGLGFLKNTIPIFLCFVNYRAFISVSCCFLYNLYIFHN